MTDENRPETEQPQGSATVEEPAPETPTEEGAPPEPDKLHQTVEMQDIGPCKKHIKITIDRGDIDKRFDEQFSKLVVDANVAGFRPGKAPRKIVERRFKKDVSDQVKGEVLLASLQQLAEEQDVAPLAPPDLDPAAIEIPEQGPMIYEFDVEVRPEFDLPEYKGLKLRRPVKTFTDQDVELEERRLLAPYGQLIPKEGAAAMGDTLIVDISSRVADRVLGELKEVQLRIEPRLVLKDAYADNFGEQVVGVRPGETRTVLMTLSQRVADPALRGVTAQLVLNVKDIKTIRIPELTHELLHQFGVHSEEQLHERVRVLLHRRLEYQQRRSAREQVLQHIAATATWELPKELLVRQARKALNRRIMEMRGDGIPDEEIQAQQRLLEQDVLRSTAMELKEHFVMQKIAEVEKLDVNEDDMEDEIERIAAMHNESARRLRARLEKEDMMDTLAAEILERKALDVILQNAEYEDVPLDKTEAKPVASLEEQAIPGEMHDPASEPPTEEAQPEATR